MSSHSSLMARRITLLQILGEDAAILFSDEIATASWASKAEILKYVLGLGVDDVGTRTCRSS
jgi:hypothetical protein